MSRCACRHGGAVLLIVLAAGCAKPPSPPSAPGVEALQAEVQVRDAFVALQAALTNGDADKLWGLLSEKSRGDAERSAKEVRTAYEQAGRDARAKQAERLGLTGEEIAELTGRGFLKTSRFRGKYDEVATGKVARVALQGASATVHWDDADGEREKTIFVREGDGWKAWLSMPTVKMP
jgi:hypothetical protein